MSSGLRALAFGSADGSVWGAAFDTPFGAQGDGVAPLLIAAVGDAPPVCGPARWQATDDGGWTLSGDGVSLTVTPRPAPTPPVDDDSGADGRPAVGRDHVAGDGPDLYDVGGTLAAAGGELTALATIASLPAASSAKDAPASARLVGAWLADGAAVALLAARPGRASHQDGDVATATLFDPERFIAVEDPRLSTTYDDAGTPSRCNLELWIGDGDDEFPRRAAAESAGPAASATGTGVTVQVVPLRCHSRGEDGAGVYALATFSG